MNSELFRYLVHYYSSPEFLFKTITMYDESELENTCQAIADKEGWYSGRFAPKERGGYMQRRLAVEDMLRTEFQAAYWSLKSKHPVYFYLMPDVSKDVLDEQLKERQTSGDKNTRYLLVDLHKIENVKQITFTLHDSLRSYRAKLIDRGVPCRELQGMASELADYGQVFPLSAAVRVYDRLEDKSNCSFEVQVWDADLLADVTAAGTSGLTNN